MKFKLIASVSALLVVFVSVQGQLHSENPATSADSYGRYLQASFNSSQRIDCRACQAISPRAKYCYNTVTLAEWCCNQSDLKTPDCQDNLPNVVCSPTV